MTAAPKFGSLWKLHCRGHFACRARFPWREAVVSREGMGKSTWRTRRGMGPSAHARIAEIKPGRAISQQGLAATCKDSLFKEDRGGERDLVCRMSQYERRRRGNALRGGPEAALEWVTPGPGKGALGTWRPRRTGPVPGRRTRTCGDSREARGQVNLGRKGCM